MSDYVYTKVLTGSNAPMLDAPPTTYVSKKKKSVKYSEASEGGKFALGFILFSLAALLLFSIA